MQNHSCGTRIQLPISGEKRKVISRRDPLAEDETGERASKSSGHNGAAPTEPGLRRSGMEFTPGSQRDSDRHAQANEESDKLGKVFPRVIQHAHRVAGMAHWENPRRHNNPQKQSGGYTPDQSRAGTGRPPGKE